MNTNLVKETSESLQLYFSLGSKSSFKTFNTLLVKNFKEKKVFPKSITEEIQTMQKEGTRIDFVHIANRLWKRSLASKQDFKTGAALCQDLIEKVYDLKTEEVLN